MTEKRYFWIKLQMDFWKSPVVKMLRKPSGGDTYVVIYLEMILLSLENNGYIYYSGVGDSFAEEIALVLDEETINVEFVLAFLKQKRLIEFSDDTSFKFTEDVTADLVGSESASARRVRAYRKRQKTIANEQKALQCNTDETNRNLDIDIDKEKDIDNNIRSFSDENDQVTSEKSVSKENHSVHKPTKKELDDRFERLWALYPRKVGKQKARKYYERAVKNGTSDKEIRKGIESYNKEIQVQGTQTNFIQHGATWFGNAGWENEYNFELPKRNNNQRQLIQKEKLPDWAKNAGKKQLSNSIMSMAEKAKAEAEIDELLRRV
ncbi:phage replisome organizer N-terminal domain-containing protein [Ligilactobacillus salivarius]|uniref:phage replisome organizer N-terminal domain-containing protein n=1 Tax=Ligilactobacillus salivarius TaxID=1624 RepID=UPI001369B465|nr:phage replisome organizer N-terminal domain-containing protein [Ligilactobacillus salivarius]MBM6708436.1 phage replisome organizer N-terminal domain-containing protein [Ligilactobacillus salivarius]MYV11210.1 replisome organizer [Ligilactobacillus salivarius]MYZ01423.1 replisome organizer [Ligilactobacillus salivarius]UIP51718.1 phage replisome organizer N-terminal domain-containing protein [Ligilactobacillus salivarius]WGC79868.1 phage replisome organizer N-terminal domain-containing prot